MDVVHQPDELIAKQIVSDTLDAWKAAGWQEQQKQGRRNARLEHPISVLRKG